MFISSAHSYSLHTSTSNFFQTHSHTYIFSFAFHVNCNSRPFVKHFFLLALFTFGNLSFRHCIFASLPRQGQVSTLGFFFVYNGYDGRHTPNACVTLPNVITINCSIIRRPTTEPAFRCNHITIPHLLTKIPSLTAAGV